ncbi:MAG: hypothetical protein ACTSUO_04155 [Candidatus Thorarchaeota archaeon]
MRYDEVSTPIPEWLDLIQIRNERELKTQYEKLGQEISKLGEEKSILCDTGKSLTKKVASLLELLGFQTEEKEDHELQDIEISDGDFNAYVECTGSTGNFGISKFRQLVDYIIDTDDTKGIFIGNPWMDKHPNERNLSEAFTEKVRKRAEQLQIALVTVPHLYRIFLEKQSDDDKTQIRKSLMNCVGLWNYPISNPDWS